MPINPKHYSLREFSHYEGARNPGRVVGTFETREEAELILARVQTCSFCRPGRAPGFSTGKCYTIVETYREADYYISADDEAAIQDCVDDIESR